jgi:60 kDa SS-A/Ro ribonucleoprotein
MTCSDSFNTSSLEGEQVSLNYSKHYSTKKTPQNEPILGKKMSKNNAGGFSFDLNDWKRLEQFLILGSEGGTYYVGERKLTVENASVVHRCIYENSMRVVDTVVNISVDGRASSNDPALFVLALCSGVGTAESKKYALLNLHKVARIGTHLFHFCQYVQQFRGWGRGLKTAVANWYNKKTPEQVAYQVLKYRQRDGWTHRDVLRLSKPTPSSNQHQELYKFVVGKAEEAPVSIDICCGFNKAQSSVSPANTCRAIEQYGIPREFIKTEHLNDIEVWKRLLIDMPMTAMVRNLAKMTSIGILRPMTKETKHVCTCLRNEKILQKARVHPMSLLFALKTYASGQGFRGNLTWEPVRAIIDALNDAFYLSFKTITPTHQNIMLALDVSGSMAIRIANSNVYAREASAVLAMVTARTESNWICTGFTAKGHNAMSTDNSSWNSSAMAELKISPTQRLDDVMYTITGLPFGRTDCALPMLYATKNSIDIDAFVIYTDNETWAGDVHPTQALSEYRNKMNKPNAKMIVVGMVSNGFSIADPADPLSLDVVGFDTNTPNLISDFIRE